MDLVELRKIAKEDTKIRPDRLDSESLNIHSLYEKYMAMFLDESDELRVMENLYKKLVLKKTQYYLGKDSPEVYENKPLDLKIIKSDVKLYLDADDDLQKANDCVEKQRAIVTYLDAQLKMIANRSFHIKNSIEWNKFKVGVDSMKLFDDMASGAE